MVEKKIFVFLAFFTASIFVILIDTSVSSQVLAPSIKFILLLIAFALDGMALSSRYYGYLIVPVFKQRSRNIVLSNDNAYYLSTTQDSIIHKEGEDFIATVYIKIPLYRSATEMTPEEKLEFTNQIARVVGIGSDPVRFTTQMHIMNKDQYISALRTIMTEVENDEAKLITGNLSPQDTERIKGKASMWRHMLDNVSKVSSLELVTYASISAKGSKEFESSNLVQQKARELMSAIASVFGVSPSVITGEAILRFVEPEYLIPYSTVREQISKTMTEEI